MSEKHRNPEVAVALRYGGSGAPKVTAKGKGPTAEKILALAAEHNIPLWQDAALADVLAHVDLDSEIPDALYRAVAEVIAFAWQLRGKSPGHAGPVEGHTGAGNLNA